MLAEFHGILKGNYFLIRGRLRIGARGRTKSAVGG